MHVQCSSKHAQVHAKKALEHEGACSEVKPKHVYSSEISEATQF